MGIGSVDYQPDLIGISFASFHGSPAVGDDLELLHVLSVLLEADSCDVLLLAQNYIVVLRAWACF
jgi:hypothetical protein